MPQKRNTEQLHAIQQTSPQLPFTFWFSAERNKQLKSQIKIVKCQPGPTPADSQAEFGTKPVEQSTREITIVVKKWIAELKERKRVTTVIGNQASSEALQ
jgi:hypothetical protein